jgi:hypothetical protein
MPPSTGEVVSGRSRCLVPWGMRAATVGRLILAVLTRPSGSLRSSDLTIFILIRRSRDRSIVRHQGRRGQRSTKLERRTVALHTLETCSEEPPGTPPSQGGDRDREKPAFCPPPWEGGVPGGEFAEPQGVRNANVERSRPRGATSTRRSATSTRPSGWPRRIPFLKAVMAPGSSRASLTSPSPTSPRPYASITKINMLTS